MVLTKLSSSLKDTLSKVRNSLTVDRNLVEEVVKEIQKALLQADVHVKLVLELTSSIRKRAIEERSDVLNKNEQLITIIYEEVSNFLGGDEAFELQPNIQNRILLVGLYGQGKTTTAGKLGNYFKARSKKVALISTDTWRPAAFEQLKQIGARVDVRVFGDPSIKDPNEIYKKFEFELSKFDIVIVDSAGRDSLNDELVEEIASLKDLVNPTDVFFVLGADVGQTAQRQAEMFKEYMDISGVIITKMDGTGKGGGALSACHKVHASVRFIGVGERVEDLERFNAQNFVSELLGMGDIEGLLEKAKLALNEKDAQNLEAKLMRGEFDLDDLAQQMRAMGKMGSMSKIMGMIPGMSGLNISKDQLGAQEEKIKRWEVAMSSMTKRERKDPSVMNNSRITRIVNGSGVESSEIRELLKQYKMMKKMITMFKNPENFKGIDEQSMQSPDAMMKMMQKAGGGKFMKQMMKGRR
ncbi:MAG: signal recognition particle receptor subunit alpha [Candidatus Woesearchaeota archaeon]